MYIAQDKFPSRIIQQIFYLPHHHISTYKQPQSTMKKALDKVGWKARALPPKGELEQQAPPQENEDIKDYQLLDINYETGEINETKIKHNTSAENFLAELDLYKNLPSIHGSKRSYTFAKEKNVISKLNEAIGEKVGESSRMQENAVLTVPKVEKGDDDALAEVGLYEETMTSLLEMSLLLDQREEALRRREEELGLTMSQPHLGSPSNFSTTRPADAGPEYTREDFMKELRRLRNNDMGTRRKSTPSPHTDPEFIRSRSASETSLYGEHGDLARRASAFWSREGAPCNSEAGSGKGELKGKGKESSSGSSTEEEEGEFFEIAVLRSPKPELVMPVLENMVESAPAILGGTNIAGGEVKKKKVKKTEEKVTEYKEAQTGGELAQDQQHRERLFEVRRVREALRMAAAGGATAIVFVLVWAVQMSLRADREKRG